MCQCVFVCCPAGGVHVVIEEEVVGASATAGEGAHHLHCTALILVWHICGGLVAWCTHEHCGRSVAEQKRWLCDVVML